ncbi:hypothetical protein [Desulfoluna sp.]|uniref:TetR/AcrR family transcriptional regulator n=1 Tax=Desulfoluna sp. TaxID=2045199 RepID=UPI002629DF21|nr:hypothetical protein [Desulfoluna sp.]
MTKKHADKMIPRLPDNPGGREKVELILACMDELLKTKCAEDISICHLSEMSGLAAQTIYRIFPSPASVCFTLANRYLGEICRVQGCAAIYENCHNWQDAVEKGLTAMRDYFRQHPQAMALMFGSGTSREIKAADRNGMRALVSEVIGFLFALRLIPEFPHMMHYSLIALELNDAVWNLSYDLHRDITDFYLAQGIRAVTAYAGLYLPVYPTVSAI